jgi:hypothetical protein
MGSEAMPFNRNVKGKKGREISTYVAFISTKEYDRPLRSSALVGLGAVGPV